MLLLPLDSVAAIDDPLFRKKKIFKCQWVIYIYIYFFKKKQRNQSQRIINLFPCCYAFLKFPKTRKKINRSSSDLFDKKTRIDT